MSVVNHYTLDTAQYVLLDNSKLRQGHRNAKLALLFRFLLKIPMQLLIACALLDLKVPSREHTRQAAGAPSVHLTPSRQTQEQSHASLVPLTLSIQHVLILRLTADVSKVTMAQ